MELKLQSPQIFFVEELGGLFGGCENFAQQTEDRQRTDQTDTRYAATDGKHTKKEGFVRKCYHKKTNHITDGAQASKGSTAHVRRMFLVMGSHVSGPGPRV